MKAAFAFAVVLAVAYLIGAFCVWDLNPGNWEPAARVAVVMMGVVGAVPVAAIASGVQP